MTRTPADDGGPGGPDRSGGLTVGAAASLVGVTVRTLHHWDTIGLVRPSGRTPRGYRVYAATDIARIHRVLLYRELGLPLDRIGGLLDDPARDLAPPLLEQRSQLMARIGRLQRMVGAVDRMIDAADRGILLSAEEQVAIFGTDWRPEWFEQARERWGHTPEWRDYTERSATRTAEDWREITATVTAIYEELGAASRSGVEPGSEAANELAERHRAGMSAYFDCSHAMQVCLMRLQATDPEFIAYYDRIEPGLAQWLRDVVEANAAAHGVDPATATWPDEGAPE